MSGTSSDIWPGLFENPTPTEQKIGIWSMARLYLAKQFLTETKKFQKSTKFFRVDTTFNRFDTLSKSSGKTSVVQKRGTGLAPARRTRHEAEAQGPIRPAVVMPFSREEYYTRTRLDALAGRVVWDNSPFDPSQLVSWRARPNNRGLHDSAFVMWSGGVERGVSDVSGGPAGGGGSDAGRPAVGTRHYRADGGFMTIFGLTIKSLAKSIASFGPVDVAAVAFIVHLSYTFVFADYGNFLDGDMRVIGIELWRHGVIRVAGCRNLPCGLCFHITRWPRCLSALMPCTYRAGTGTRW